ncbi:MAG: citrate synthase [Myxococcales bacterium]|nr:citrate synthase [Myxococcales bacterium]
MSTPEYLTAREAVAMLGIKPATLYTYVSRGWVTRVPDPERRGSLYLRSDITRLKQRHDARAGHTAVAAGALRWGEPVIDSAITTVVDGQLYYRGRNSADLLAEGASYEQVAELLWGGALPDREPCWADADDGVGARSVRAALRRGAGPIRSLLTSVALLRAQSERIAGEGAEPELRRARALIRWLASGPGWAKGRPPGRRDGVARRVTRALGVTGEEAEHAVEAALVLAADHELNTSTFAARVTASAGSDLYACIAAALAALSGPLHGGATLRVEALLEEAMDSADPGDVVRERLARGARLPGFGHPLYPDGDPRARLVLEHAHRIDGSNPRLAAMDAIALAMDQAGRGGPNLDFGLVALAQALGAGPSSAGFLFACGRLAGWVAHIHEQRVQGERLRPRARYVGELPG